MDRSREHPTEKLRSAAARAPGCELLLLFGSRGRGSSHAASDWDFGYLSGEGFDPLALVADLADLLRTDRIDLANLRRASPLLRFHAARDGIEVFARSPEVTTEFRIAAATFWCDAGPVIDRAYEAVLDSLGES